MAGWTLAELTDIEPAEAALPGYLQRGRKEEEKARSRNAALEPTRKVKAGPVENHFHVADDPFTPGHTDTTAHGSKQLLPLQGTDKDHRHSQAAVTSPLNVSQPFSLTFDSTLFAIVVVFIPAHYHYLH